jgi:hypothetical protein
MLRHEGKTMKEFRKTRIQREIAEILSTIDQPRQSPQIPPPSGYHFHPEQLIGLAFLFCTIGVLMGYGVSMRPAEENGPLTPYQFMPINYLEYEPASALSGSAFPELPEIEVIYVPNSVQSENPVSL